MAVLALLVLAEPSSAVAQSPFDFLFGSPYPYRQRAYRRPRHKPTDAPKPTPPGAESRVPEGPAPVAAPPTPPPRPEELKPTDATPAKSEPAPAIVPPSAPSPAEPPMPPPKPDDLKPAEPAGVATPPAEMTPAAPLSAAPGKSEPPPPKSEPKLEPKSEQVPAPEVVVPTPPPKPGDLAKPSGEGAAKPEPTKPSMAPSGAAPGDVRQPVDDASCMSQLDAHKVKVEAVTIGKQVDDRCTVAQAVKLESLTLPDGGKVDFPDRPTLACITADAFGRYISESLAPLAKGTFGVAVVAVSTGPGLECRSRDHIAGAKLSAHGQGLAIDIAQLKLADGKVVAVGAPDTPAEAAFESAARAAGCGYFHTALGPGADSFHKTHWHFDLEPRGSKGDAKFCQ